MRRQRAVFVFGDNVTPNKRMREIEYREFSIDATCRVNEAEKTVDASLSSEEPALRWDGWEVLEHSSEAVDMQRARLGLPLLENHNTREVVGIIERVRIEGKKLRGQLRFGTTARARELWEDVKAGIRRNMSIGYLITKQPRTIGDRDGVPVYMVNRWQPMEASLVAIGLDPTVGVGRELELYQEGAQIMSYTTDQRSTRRAARSEEDQQEQYARVRELRSDQLDAAGERQRVAEIMAIRRRFPKLEGIEQIAEEAIRSGASIAAFNEHVLRLLDNTQRAPRSTLPAYENERHIETPRHRGPLNGFVRAEDAHEAGMWLLATIFHNERAHRWCDDRFGSQQMRAAAGGINTAGGALVPDVLSNAVIMNSEEFGVFRGNARVVPMSSDTTIVPVRTGGLQAAFVGENAEASESDVTWTNVTLIPQKIMTLSRISSEVLEDAVLDLAMWLAMEIGLSFATVEDQCGFVGDGTSAFGGMTGLLTKIEADSNLAGHVLGASGNDLFSEITGADLAKAMGALPAYAVRNAKWFCSQQAFSNIFERIVSAAGGNTLESLAMPARRQYLGYPIIVSQALPTSTADLSNKVMALFGDLPRAALFGARREVRVNVSTDRFLEFDQVAITGSERFHIVVHDVGTDAVAGPVVGLVGN
jgi:HK97 family phage major capsid protein